MIPDHTRTAPIQELLQRFHGAKYISSIDLSSAFLQVQLHPECRKFTAFLFENQVYQYTRVPYGLRTSLPAFIRALNLALGSDTAYFALAYVDDITVFSPTFQQHLEHLTIVIDRLTKAGFTINAGKCNFCKPEISFLGHVISNGGVAPDPKRIDAILNYPRPRNTKQLKQFLGVCNYHNRFIINYSEYVAPLLPLLKKGTKWRWTAELQQAFELLRSKFASSIHLIHPDETMPYSISTDASKRAIGAVLLQTDKQGETHIVCTASRVLSQIEQRYSVAEQELLAIVYALEKFRIYVYGHEITVHTDNKSLSFLDKCSLSSSRIARWVMQLQEYQLKIQHVSGARNFLADAISRNPAGVSEAVIRDLSKPRSITIAAIDLDIDGTVARKLKNLATFQKQDAKLQELINSTKLCQGQTDKYLVRNDVLYFKDTRDHQYWRPVVPTALETDVIRFVHKSTGHSGTEKCMGHISHTFYIKNLGRKVRKLIAGCDICQRTKHPNRSYAVETRSHLPSEPGMLCACDVYGQLPTGRGGTKYIFVILDVFSKFVRLYALKKATTRACLNKIVGDYIPNVVKPQKLLSDHGSQFNSPVWKKKLQELGIEPMYSPVRNPNSNPSERILCEVGKFCRIYCNRNHKTWAELIPHIEKWMNESISESTGYTPIELLTDKPRPDLFAKVITKDPDQLPQGEDRETRALKAYLRMKKRAERRNKRNKVGRHLWDPQLGDMVLAKHQTTSDAIAGVTSKFGHVFQGPFKITTFTPPAMFELTDLNGKIRGVFNKKALKPYINDVEARTAA
jgi:transposase InsO family protein